MSGMGARSACFRFPQLMQTKTRRAIPDSMSISRSSNIDPLHFSQVCMKLVPMILPRTAGSSLTQGGMRELAHYFSPID